MDRFPGASNAEVLRQLLEGYLPDIVAVQRDDSQALALRSDLGRWRSHVDTVGIPKEVLETADRYVEIARDALRRTVDVKAAEGALLEARRLFTR